MRIFTFFFLIIFGFLNLLAQERFVKPVDEAKTDASFFAFRAKLIEAAKKRDAKYVLSVADADIKNDFGGNDGIAEFKKFWKLERANSEFWNEFLPVVTNGGKFDNQGNTKLFFAPYAFNSFPDDVDSFTYSAIFGSSVNLRERADAKSKTVGQLSYNIVKVDFENSVKKAKKRKRIRMAESRNSRRQKGFCQRVFRPQSD